MSGFKIANIVSMMVFYAFLAGFIVANSRFPSKTVLPLAVVGIIFLLILLLIKDSYYIRVALRNHNEDVEPDPFLIYVVRLVRLDSHFSVKEKSRVQKYFKKKYGWFGGLLQMKNLEMMIETGKDSDKEFYNLKTNHSRSYRLRLMQQLIGIAISDKFLSNKEKEFLERVAKDLGLTQNDLKIIFRLYNYVTEEETEYQRLLKSKPNYQLTRAYSILGLEPTVSFEEVKDAYRSLVKVYHPDKLAKSSKNKEGAKKQFQAIVDAYEAIKKIKG